MTTDQLIIKVGKRIKGMRLVAGYELREAAEKMCLEGVSELEEVEEGDASPSVLMFCMLSALYAKPISFFSPRYFKATKSDDGVWELDDDYWDEDTIAADIIEHGPPSAFELIEATREYQVASERWLRKIAEKRKLQNT